MKFRKESRAKNLMSFLQAKTDDHSEGGEIGHHMAKEIMQQIGAKIEDYLPIVCVLDYKNVSFMAFSGIAVILFTL